MPRHVLDEAVIHPAVHETIAARNRDLVEEVQSAVARSDYVVVGMQANSHVKAARKALEERGLDVTYLGYGGYHNLWRRRNALKMWTGWPTFPMVFVHGVFVGGARDLRALIENGEFENISRPTAG